MFDAGTMNKVTKHFVVQKKYYYNVISCYVKFSQKNLIVHSATKVDLHFIT